MSRYLDRLSLFIPLYRLGPAAGRVGIVLIAICCTTAVASAQAWSQSCCDPAGGSCGQINAAALAAPPCGLCSYARIWLKPGCVPPSFCKYRCNDSTHIWDGYSNQQSEKLNRQLARQLYHLQKQHIARGWPWYGGYYGQQPCPGFGPATIGVGGMSGGPCPGGPAAYPGTPDGAPCEGEGRAEVISDEAVEGAPVETSEAPTLSPVPAEPAETRITPLPPVETAEPGETDAAKSS